MAGVSLELKGGANLARYLNGLASRVGNANVRVGFLENADYPAKFGKPALRVAQVAFWNEFGTSRIPARPFFRTMIRTKSSGWGPKLANVLKSTDYDGGRSMALMGQEIQGQLQERINQGFPPPNAPSTVAKKGFDHPLIDKAVMLRAVDFEVMR